MRRRKPWPLAASLTAAPQALAVSLCALFFTLALPGCEEPKHLPGQKTAAPKKEEDKFIVGKRTQDIRDADAEVQNKGAKVTTPRITAKDPITLQGNAYVTMIGKTSILQIEHAMRLYQAANDRYPADLKEFMTEIIQANNLALPKLPHYQEYGYDAKEHKLVILEYPDRRN